MAGFFGETAELVALLKLNDQFTGPLKRADGVLGRFDSHLGNTSGRAYRAGQQIGTGIRNGVKIAAVGLTALAGLLLLSVKEGQAAANVQKIYAQAIANSGRVSAAQVGILNAQQKALEGLAGVDDELIKSEQTRLIQMRLSGKAVAALTPLILDAAKATGKDLLTVTIAAGKAANGNAGALKRLGIEVDKVRFKADPLAETIRVLNQRFGGTTRTLSGSLDTRLAVLRERLSDVREEAGIKLLPVLTRIVDVVGSKVVPAFGKFIDRILPEVNAGLNQFADALANGGAENAIRGITDALGPMVDLIKIAAAPVKAIVSAFLQLPKGLQTVLVGAFAVNKLTGGLVTNAVGGLVETLGKALIGGIKAPLVNVTGGVVNVGGGIPGTGGGGGLPGAAAGVAGLGLGGLLSSLTVIAGGIALIVATEQEKRDMNPTTRASLNAALAAPHGRFGFVKIAPGSATIPVREQSRTHPDPLVPRLSKATQKSINELRVVAILQSRTANVSKDLQRQAVARLKDADSSVKHGTTATTSAGRRNAEASRQAGGTAARAALGAGRGVVNALHRLPRPITNITVKVSVTPGRIQQSSTVQNSYGPANGSAGGGSGNTRNVPS